MGLNIFIQDLNLLNTLSVSLGVDGEIALLSLYLVMLDMKRELL